MAEEFIAKADAGRLLNAAVNIEGAALTLSERRQRFLVAIAELIQADAGHWAWGRGHPETSTIAPVAMLDCGYSAEQKSLFIQSALDPEAMRPFHAGVLSIMHQRRQSSTVRRDVFSDAQWHASHWFQKYMSRMGMDSWVHCLNYDPSDTWSNMFLVRRAGQPEFGDREAAILDVAMASIPWLHPRVDETLPPETFVGLTPRQRTVLLLQLDGKSRKQIALQLQITEQTVGDHLKALYEHFGVHSSSELAARFLRSA